jgi:pyruvate formate lyase activating enzyme
LDGYFLKNAQHININVLSRKMLEDADRHPEKYPNLTIRVGGYCVKFGKLSHEQREEVIHRTMHSSSVTTFFNRADQRERTVPLWKDSTLVKGTVYSMETFSTTDGPGIRTNVFLQGCPKRCVFCCNPETQVMCDPEKRPEFAMTDAEIAAVVDDYKDFLQPQNGGVTMSGGEPLLQPNFVAAVFKRVHGMGLTTCLDTACFGNEADWDKVLQHTDYVMLCLKGMDNEVASRVAQHPARFMARSKDFARFIRDRYSEDVKLSLRWVLLKGITDTSAELKKLIEFAKDLRPVFTHVELIPYHDLGKDKYNKLELEYPLDEMKPYLRDDALSVQDTLEAAGVKTTLSII